MLGAKAYCHRLCGGSVRSVRIKGDTEWRSSLPGVLLLGANVSMFIHNVLHS